MSQRPLRRCGVVTSANSAQLMSLRVVQTRSEHHGGTCSQQHLAVCWSKVLQSKTVPQRNARMLFHADHAEGRANARHSIISMEAGTAIAISHQSQDQDQNGAWALSFMRTLAAQNLLKGDLGLGSCQAERLFCRS